VQRLDPARYGSTRSATLGIVQENVTAGVRPRVREQSRERILSDEELNRVWRACDELGCPGAPIVRTPILTGARRDEIGRASWSEIDLEVSIGAGQLVMDWVSTRC
jgi:integrase